MPSKLEPRLRATLETKFRDAALVLAASYSKGMHPSILSLEGQKFLGAARAVAEADGIDLISNATTIRESWRTEP